MVEPNDSSERFGVAAEFVEACAVLTLTGSLDLVGARELAEQVNAMVDRGAHSLILDLSHLDFIDSSGLQVIADGSDRLTGSGGILALRFPPAMVRRILDITGLGHLAMPEPSHDTAHGEHLGREELASEGAANDHPLAAANLLRKVTAIPADDDVVDGALRLVVALARATVGGADGVSVSLRRHGRLSTVAASDETILDMDADQYSTGEGPCVSASIEGRWFHIESLADETRWPAFTPKAHELGINSILSSPLLPGDRPVGALNIYSRTTGAFTPRDQELAALFATEASTILAEAGVAVTDEEVSAQVQDALRTRQVIAQAQGMIMQKESLPLSEAFASLRRQSETSGLSLVALAERMVGTFALADAPTPLEGHDR